MYYTKEAEPHTEKSWQELLDPESNHVPVDGVGDTPRNRRHVSVRELSRFEAGPYRRVLPISQRCGTAALPRAVPSPKHGNDIYVCVWKAEIIVFIILFTPLVPHTRRKPPPVVSWEPNSIYLSRARGWLCFTARGTDVPGSTSSLVKRPSRRFRCGCFLDTLMAVH